jgi:hypothetical protein
VEHWAPLDSYPGYSVSDQGRVRNDRRDSVLAMARNQNGITYTCLMQDGVQVKRTISRLVAQTFVQNERPGQFTTPIHLDGDLTNCQAGNLLWRPRWFAIKFTRQFRLELPNTRPLREVKTREVFENPWPPVMTWGLLYMDIVLAIINRAPVFPTWQLFEEVL